MTRRYRQGARAEAARTTERRILDAAVQHFSAEPFDNVSLAAIAADADVTVQTILRVFESKPRLFERAATSVRDEVIAAREGALEQDLDGAIRVLCTVYERWGDATSRLIAQHDRVPVIGAVIADGVAYHREWTRRLFAGRRSRQELATLVAILDLSFYRLLRAQGLSERSAQEALRDAVTAILRE